MKFRPLNDRVLIKRVESETKTACGLSISRTTTTAPSTPSCAAKWPLVRAWTP